MIDFKELQRRQKKLVEYVTKNFQEKDGIHAIALVIGMTADEGPFTGFAATMPAADIVEQLRAAADQIESDLLAPKGPLQ